MAKEETKESKAAAMAAAVAKANKEAGYDIALAFAALSALKVNEQVRMDVPIGEMQADVVAVADIVNRATGGTLDPQTLGMLMELCIAYGWHWRDRGESLLQSETAYKELLAYVDGRKDMLVEAKMHRKDGITKGLMAVAEAVAVVKEKMKMC